MLSVENSYCFPVKNASGDGSGGVSQSYVDDGDAAALASAKAYAESIASGENLLINPDFRINQRGQAEYSTSAASPPAYTVDRWRMQNDFKLVVADDGVSVSPTADTAANLAALLQNVPINSGYEGKSVTLSAICAGSDNCYLRAYAMDDSNAILEQTESLTLDAGSATMTIPQGATKLRVAILFAAGSTAVDVVTLRGVKIEVGGVATPFVPPNPATELLKCQRYYQIRSTGDIDPVDLRPTMAVITDIKERSDGNYEYIAEL